MLWGNLARGPYYEQDRWNNTWFSLFNNVLKVAVTMEEWYENVGQRKALANLHLVFPNFFSIDL